MSLPFSVETLIRLACEKETVDHVIKVYELGIYISTYWGLQNLNV